MTRKPSDKVSRPFHPWRALGASLVLVPVLLTVTFIPSSAQRTGAAAPQSIAPREFVNQYCVGCHNARLKTGNLILDKVDPENVGPDAATWEKVIGKLRAGMMPPAGAKRPENALLQPFLEGLEARLDAASPEQSDPGITALHRLNRTEYANAIRTLTALEVDPANLLPPDDASDGFDNIADVLGVSPALLERYLAAAAKISRIAVGNPNIAPSTVTYRVRDDLTQTDHIEGLPLGTRGGLLVQHTFPLDAEYVFKMTPLRTSVGALFGQFAEGESLELLVDGNRVQRFELNSPNSAAPPPGDGTYEGNAGRLPVFAGTAGAPAKGPDSQGAAAGRGAPVGRGAPAGRGGATGVGAAGAGTPTRAEAAAWEARISLKAGPHTIGVAFVNRTSALSDDLWQLPRKSTTDVPTGQQVGYTTVPHLASVAITGPFNTTGSGETPSRQKIFICRPSNATEEIPCARRILAELIRKAYRRPVIEADFEAILKFYQAGRNQGSFERGIESALRRILADPQFIFRFEREPENVKAGEAYAISGLELASRLSFFIWSDLPDDELLTAAVQGKLTDPASLLEQTKRMLRDSRSRSLVENFAGQWLGLRELKNVSPQSADFDDNLRQAMRTETEMLFDTIRREDRSVLDLLTADYTFVNERLAKHYGIPHVYGSQFRRVSLPDPKRRGILGQGSVLTITSVPNRTSPVARGKWILENILGTPAPLPPPNIPPLPENAQNRQESASVRERMELHRANAVCASCHKIMDPFGFALENFDNTGKWRDKDGTSVVNAGSQLVDGSNIEGPVGLRNVLLGSYSKQFVRTFSAKLMTFALGRTLRTTDMPRVRMIARASEVDGNKFSTIVAEIVSSPQFRMRTKKPSEPRVVASVVSN